MYMLVAGMQVKTFCGNGSAWERTGKFSRWLRTSVRPFRPYKTVWNYEIRGRNVLYGRNIFVMITFAFRFYQRDAVTALLR